MELVYSSLLLHNAKKDITEESIKKVLSAAGIEKSDGEVKAAVAAMKGINIDETLKEAAVAPVAQAPAGDASAGAKEEKKKEPEEEKKSAEQAAAGLGALFG